MQLQCVTFWMMTTEFEGQSRATAEMRVPSLSFEISSSSITSIFVAIDSQILGEERTLRIRTISQFHFFFFSLLLI